MRKVLAGLLILGVGVSAASSLSAAPEEITPPVFPVPGFDFDEVHERLADRSEAIAENRESFTELATEVQASIDDMRQRPWYDGEGSD